MLAGRPQYASTLSAGSPSVLSLLPQRMESASAGIEKARAAASSTIPGIDFLMAPLCLAAGERRLKLQAFNVRPRRGPYQGRTDQRFLKLARHRRMAGPWG